MFELIRVALGRWHGLWQGLWFFAAGLLIWVAATTPAAAQDQENADLAVRAAKLADDAERRLGSAEAHASNIESLRRTVDQVLALLEGAREVNDGLKTDVNMLSRSLTESDVEGEKVRDLNAELELKIAELTLALLTVRSQGDDTRSDLEAERRRLEEMNRNLAALEQDVAGRDAAILELRAKIAKMTQTLAEEREQSTARQNEKGTLESQLSALAQNVAERDAAILELQAKIATLALALARERQQSTAQQSEKSTLESQLSALQAQRKMLIAERNDALRQIFLQKQKIDNLESERRQAAAGELEELARYRSEFFGRLRRVLGGRRDILVVGDRFVFQAEVLFASGSAELGLDGQKKLTVFAATLLEISARFPRGLGWVLRVDGHTDKNPIATVRYPSNWELSAARAISVVRFLVRERIPAGRLVAAGFGEHYPVDGGTDEIADRRNRRIEMKLTQR